MKEEEVVERRAERGDEKNADVRKIPCKLGLGEAFGEQGIRNICICLAEAFYSPG